MNLFVSYRRSDTQDFAGRLVDRLRQAPSISAVFMDVDEIAPGADFVAALRQALAKCDVCLLLIGASWRAVRDDGTARIDEPSDFVRLEAATALAGGNRILPILANGAAMPSEAQLPDELKPLSRINAAEVRHVHFEQDFYALLDAIHGRRYAHPAKDYLRRHPVQYALVRALVGMLAAAVVLVLGAALHQATLRRPLEESLGGPGPVWLLLVLSLAAGAFAGITAGQRRDRA